ncbi:hypothetical protein PYCC9005_003185 [Savitreella phatthalungensis]
MSSEPSSTEPQAQSFKCDECGKLLKDTTLASWHADKTGHQAFSESTDPIVPLTEEEKAEKLAYLREKLAVKRAKQAEEDAENAKKNAAIERKKTQESAQLQEELQRKEELKQIEKAKRQKREDAEAKQRVLAQIAQDKAERAARAKGEVMPAAAPTIASHRQDLPTAAKKADLSVARLQIRVVGRSPLTRTFDPQTTLRQVAEDVSAETGIAAGSAKFRTFGQQLDLDKTLSEQKLVPSAALQLST